MTRTNNALRFGMNVGARPFDEAVALCKVAEEAGFDTVGFFADRPPGENLEAWTLATAVGVLTKRVILTHVTLNVPYRNPALTAKMAASLDVITGAAGWSLAWEPVARSLLTGSTAFRLGALVSALPTFGMPSRSCAARGPTKALATRAAVYGG